MAADAIKTIVTRPSPNGGMECVETTAPLSAFWSDPTSITALASMLRIDRRTLAEAITSGDIPAQRLGSLVQIPVSRMPSRYQANFARDLLACGEMRITEHLQTNRSSDVVGIE